MNYFDWLIIIVYGVGMIGMSVYLGRNQESEGDYYLGSNDLAFWSIGISTMATQCSTNSLLGAPAFVIAVGGLLWLQYEIAVPLAVIAVMIFLLPFFRKQMRKEVAKTRFIVRAGDRRRKKPQNPKRQGGPRKKVKITISIGVAERNERYGSPAQVIQAADKALYRAKKKGRNRLSK